MLALLADIVSFEEEIDRAVEAVSVRNIRAIYPALFAVYRINILDKILQLENISIGFVLVESKRKNLIYGRTFGSRLNRYSAKTVLAKMLQIVILLFISTATLAQAQEWLQYVRGLGLWERLAEIRSVSDLPKGAQRDRVSALIQLLKDEDQSVRLAAAAEIAEIREVSDLALPRLIENFQQPHGEEGMGYVEAVAAFGERALPLLQQALGSSNWLVRARACDGVRKIKPKLYRDGECKHRAP